MKKHKKWIIILLILSVIGYVVYALFFKDKDTSNVKTATKSASESSNTNTNTNTDKAWPLRRGSNGEAVSMLQEWLNARMADSDRYGTATRLTVDGLFGLKTEEAVQRALNGSSQVSKSMFEEYIM